MSKQQREDADHLITKQGKELDGVSNLWIPFLLISTEMLHEGGAFAFVLPSELFATKSAGLVRSELIRNFERLRIDLYQRGYFPKILQDVIVLSGRRTKAEGSKRRVEFVEHAQNGERRWSHAIPATTESWTRYLLSEEELSAYVAASKLPQVRRVRDVASIGVAIVTGANEFFTVDDATVREYDLQRWAKPLLARTGDCPGLVFSTADHDAARASGRRAWILDFAADAPNPMSFAKPREYLQEGVQQGLPERYKCRIRQPWYRVPDIRSDGLMLSKRAHQFHRLILNQAATHTTDTIYRGHMLPAFQQWERSMVAAFHNSLTILASEVEGRTYGGGVLELIPSELGRLVVPIVDAAKHLPALDRKCRAAGGQLDADDTLILATDTMLVREVPALADFLPTLTEAREHLRRRRFFG